MKVASMTPTNKLISRLRLMAESGGMLTRDRLRTVSEAADRLEELDERVAIMMDGQNVNVPQVIFNAMNNNDLFGGDADEEH